ncbi:DUF4386 domain-containing protein [Glycomyces sp. L485]|uniref:DUF4386 family protein n=1 Tax=Glycomyces sp. L485 TaxID=2909235 RepID=UPI001F4A9F3D|nr:DUF4386 family protein [Glycomyces sp. L485]MCH7232732.1 DUF4386 domain-containing protein [Glycomyces sp. L485]
MSSLLAGRTVGAQFLSAFLLYGGGSAMADQPIGIGLILLNSIAVAAIGALMLGPLRPLAPRVARAYLGVRIAEAVLLGTGAFLLASGDSEGNDVLYGAAMLILAVGSIPLCLALAEHRWAPKWLCLWGVAGYALLGLGAILEFMVPGAGVVLSVPGGLFEIAFGLLLLRQGFPQPASASPRAGALVK